jgi:hypothetical protein
MKKSLLTLSLLGPMLFTGTTLAFPTGEEFDVEVEENEVGTVEARNRVVDRGSYCQYTLQWTNDAPPLSRTVRCDIRERKASNAFDCQDNAERWVTTLIERSGSCSGFDEFGQQTRITTLILGETRRGASGVFFASSVGDLQSIEIN